MALSDLIYRCIKCGFVILLGISCSNKSDFYNSIPLKSELNVDMLSKANQIIQHDNAFILLYNQSNNWEYIDNMLLFYSKRRLLEGVCYFPAVRVDSVRKNVIFGTEHEDKLKRQHMFLHDLPGAYEIRLTKSQNGASSRKSDKIVVGMSFNPKDFNVVLAVRKSSDPYEGLEALDEPHHLQLNKYIHQDTLYRHVSELFIQYGNRWIVLDTLDAQGNPRSDFLIVKDSTILDEFYRDIMKPGNLRSH